MSVSNKNFIWWMMFYEAKLTSTKWGKITKCSPDAALRDIQDLVGKGILRKTNEGGRSTNYELVL